MNTVRDIIIVGAGLSGLSTAYFLKRSGIQAMVLEANHRLGGRIFTQETGSLPMELGATWVFQNNPTLIKLIRDLKIELVPQYQEGYGLYEIQKTLPPEKFDPAEISGGIPYFKMLGGSSQIINRLADHLDPEIILTGTSITEIIEEDDLLILKSSENREFKAKRVILTLPPKLLSESIKFQPGLPEESTGVRDRTHTWMGDSIKFTIEYPSAFWRDKGSAGLALSMGSIAREIQDHAFPEKEYYGLVGFLSDRALPLSFEERKTSVVEDLTRIFGSEARDFLNYEDKVWSEESTTSAKHVNEGLQPHENNGHPLLAKTAMQDKLYFAGAETSDIYPGYMEGALISAQKVAEKLIRDPLLTPIKD